MLQKVLTKVCGKYYDYKDNKIQVVKICVETYESYDAQTNISSRLQGYGSYKVAQGTIQ